MAKRQCHSSQKACHLQYPYFLRLNRAIRYLHLWQTNLLFSQLLCNGINLISRPTKTIFAFISNRYRKVQMWIKDKYDFYRTICLRAHRINKQPKKIFRDLAIVYFRRRQLICNDTTLCVVAAVWWNRIWRYKGQIHMFKATFRISVEVDKK